MKVRIVCYEDVHEWILGKFALKMRDELAAMSVDVDIDKTTSGKADINHHIIYSGYPNHSSTIDTLMITHIDTIAKRNSLRKSLETAEHGICMSKELMLDLARLGIPRERLSFINPAHDGLITP
ncbi:MAG: hypothetical protein M0R68_12475, partial [Bacteroidetes bacterium]|nr:hypothetical protein [Bacteroidota bacterium]